MSLKARSALLADEKQLRMLILKEFQDLQQRQKAKFQALLTEIQSFKEAGSPVPVSFLFERDRLATLLVDLAQDIKDLMSGTVARDLEKNQQSATEIAAADTERLIQTYSGKKQIVRFDSLATQQIIGSTQLGEPLGDLLSKIASPVAALVKTAIIDGVATGSGAREIARGINDALGTGSVAALTIARTESNQAFRKAAVAHYQANSDLVKKYIWIAALDLRTCLICWSRHGKAYPLNKKPQSHVNCRCTMVPELAGMAQIETGESQFAKLTRQQKIAILGKARADLYDQGFGLSDFVSEISTKYGQTPVIKPLSAFGSNPKPPVAPKAKKKAPAASKPAPAAAQRVSSADLFKFKDRAEAQAHMSKLYPHITFDFGGMDLKLINENAKEFDRLAKLFPEVADRLGYIGTYVDKTAPVPYYRLSTGEIKSLKPTGKEWRGGGAYAHASVDGVRIGLNPKEYADFDALAAKRKRGRDSGWSVSEKVIGSMTHEFGHQVDHWLQSIWNEYAVSDYVAPSGAGELQDIISKWKRKYKVDRTTSEYATKNKAEAFAEAFSMIHNRSEDEWSVYATQLNNLITVIQQNLQKITSDHYTGDPVAGKAKLKKIYDQLGLKM